MDKSEMKVYTDGGARGNPGPSAAGVAFINPQGKVVKEISKYLGVQTNNYAEYTALLIALEEADKIKIKRLDCYLDSELIVRQMAGVYRVKNAGLKPIYEKVKKLACGFEWIRFSHVKREHNKIADSLVNKALDAHQD